MEAYKLTYRLHVIGGQAHDYILYPEMIGENI